MELLKGIRVVSFNHFFLGPVGVQFLADLGADVIAVEPLDGAFQRHWSGGNQFVDGQSMLFLCGNRNKRSLALDLKHPRGREIAAKLAAGADVLAENFRPGVMEGLGLGYEQVRESNPRIVYASASGYGADGPYADRPGQDLLVQAMSGLMAISGTRHDPARAVGVSAADHHGAALLALGILAALAGRTRSGQGCKVDVNLLSAAIDLQAEGFTVFANGPRPKDVRQPALLAGWYFPAPYGVYPAKDGHLALSLNRFKPLGEALGSAKLAAIPDAEGYDRREEIAGLVARLVAGRSLEELERALSAQAIWHQRVNDYDAVMADPQVRHNGSFMPVTAHTGRPLTLVGHPIRYDGHAPEVRLPPQPLGAQTAEILGELGYSAADIELLEREGAVRTAARQ